MKINGTPPQPGAGVSTPARTGTSRASAQLKSGESGEVSLSDLASRLQSIETSVDQPFDASRVESLKQAIRDGRFQVNPDVVADRLIQDLKKLLAPGAKA